MWNNVHEAFGAAGHTSAPAAQSQKWVMVSMKVNRLINIVLLLLMICAVAGFLSIHAELTAAASAANHTETAVPRMRGDQPLLMEAELLPAGKQVLLVPQAADILVKRGGRVEQLGGTCQFGDGKLYVWRQCRKTRVWLFAVISDAEPRVSVER